MVDFEEANSGNLAKSLYAVLGGTHPQSYNTRVLGVPFHLRQKDEQGKFVCFKDDKKEVQTDLNPCHWYGIESRDMSSLHHWSFFMEQGFTVPETDDDGSMHLQFRYVMLFGQVLKYKNFGVDISYADWEPGSSLSKGRWSPFRHVTDEKAANDFRAVLKSYGRLVDPSTLRCYRYH
jgi:hypothetical protein